jgi:acetate kinase
VRHESKSPQPSILAVNGGSSSIKFSLFEFDRALVRTLEGQIKGIGLKQGSITIKCLDPPDSFSRPVSIPGQTAAVSLLLDWVAERVKRISLVAVGHRIVHGGQKYWKPIRLTPEVIGDLRQLRLLDPDHLPQEIRLAEEFQERFPAVPQVACFDTDFHHDMPPVARCLPIPRRYAAQGVRRYGFHGLSYAYLIQELERVAGPNAASGRVILAHLGSGASLAAVFDGRSIDTTMSLTPASGLPMSTRSGDLDPGLVSYLARHDNMTTSRFDHMVCHESGLLGVSETSPDMQELLAIETNDARAAEAVSLFCYQAKKWIGAYAAALGGLDTLVFSGGIGENAPAVRARICTGLQFLGVELNESLNEKSAAVISKESERVAVRVIRTDEEEMIARATLLTLGFVP